MTTLPATYLRARLIAQFRRAQERPIPDRVAMIFISQRLAALR